MGLGLVSATTISASNAPLGGVLSAVAMWVCMGGAVIFAFTRGRPAGLMRLRAIDLLWGASFGLGLRLLQGGLSGSGAEPFPSAATLDGSLSLEWWFTTGLASGGIAPFVEEFFFRAVVLIAIYQVLRRAVGGVAAGFTATLASAGGFVLFHAAFNPATLVDSIQLFAVGAVCGVLVLLTGRIWGAVLVHICYNVSYLVLVVVATAFR
ncbi:CPBP family intramembrane glutamic endopeptidase [Microbacterium testaceum]|uniref:CPBP family intramembrane glutamic endopeptidase n=1 Tax=Microbacterium testaceum TaxID=2033 RepID=UPI0034358F1C